MKKVLCIDFIWISFFVFKLRNIEILQDHVFSESLWNNLYTSSDRENINYITKCVSVYLQLEKNSSYATRREFNTKRILGTSKKLLFQDCQREALLRRHHADEGGYLFILFTGL